MMKLTEENNIYNIIFLYLKMSHKQTKFASWTDLVKRTITGYAVRAGHLEWTQGSSNYVPFQVAEIVNPQPQARLILAASLFGTNRTAYLDPLLRAIKQYHDYNRHWVVRVYLSPAVDESWYQELLEASAEIYLMNRDTIGLDGMYWRFLVLKDKIPATIIDSDDEFDLSLAKAWQRWLFSNKQFYWKPVWVEHYLWPIRAQHWAARDAPLPQVEELLNNHCRSCNVFGCDEQFLNTYLYPLFKSKNVMIDQSHTTNEIWIFILIIVVVILIVAVLAWYLAKK